MSRAQRCRLGLLYGAIAAWCRIWGVYEQRGTIDWLADSMKQVSLLLLKEIFPFSLLLIFALVVYGLFRAAASVLERLNGISLAAHSTLHTNYRKARTYTV